MHTTDDVLNHLTFEQIQSEGSLPLPRALRCLLMLAEAFRQAHDSGKVVGAISLSEIVLTPAGVLLNATQNSDCGPASYTAPEVLQGCSPDVRSDIFTFGALAYEIVTGQRALKHDRVQAPGWLRADEAAPSTGIPVLDRLIGKCMARNPSARYPRMSALILEVRLLAMSAHRADEDRARREAIGSLREELRQFEAGVEARLAERQNRLLEVEHAANELLGSVRRDITEASCQVLAAQERLALTDQQLETLKQGMAQLGGAADALNHRVTRLEQQLEALGQGAGRKTDEIAAQFQQFVIDLRKQEAATESVRAALAHSADLIERTIEALEAFHDSVTEPEFV